MMNRELSKRSLLPTLIVLLVAPACQETGEPEAQPPVPVEEAVPYKVIETEDISSGGRRRLRAYIYSTAESRASRFQTSIKAAFELQQGRRQDYVKVFHLILPDENQIGLGTYYADVSFAPDGGGVNGKDPLRNGSWEARLTDEVLGGQTLKVEELWWKHRSEYQRDDGYGGTETDEEAFREFIAGKLGIDVADVKLASLWLEAYP